jgi:glycosyltransferase involved in cell wall biosynthesis
MRSLVITPTPSHPTTEGNRARVRQIAGALHRHGAVDMLFVPVDAVEPGVEQAMGAAWDTLYVVPPEPARAPRRVPSHWGVDEWMGPRQIEAARFLSRSVRYDIVVAHYVFCSLLLAAFAGTGALRVLDTHDRYGDRHVSTRAAGLRPHWFYTTGDEEARGFARADLVVAIQPEEGAYFRTITKVPLQVIEYALPPHPLPPRGRRRLAVGCVASANPWNLASIAALDRVLAGALAERAAENADFWLLGGACGSLPGLAALTPMGRFADPVDAYAGLDLVLNPALGGSGQKIKTVEALAYRRPVLSTALGGMGLLGLHRDLGHADIEALVTRLLEVLEAPEQIEHMAREIEPAYALFHAEVDGKLDRLVRYGMNRAAC